MTREQKTADELNEIFKNFEWEWEVVDGVPGGTRGGFVRGVTDSGTRIELSWVEKLQKWFWAAFEKDKSLRFVFGVVEDPHLAVKEAAQEASERAAHWLKISKSFMRHKMPEETLGE